MVVARDSEILRVPEICAELEGVIPMDLAHVINKLVLPLKLLERAIATIIVQRVAKLRSSVTALIAIPGLMNVKIGHTGGVEIVQIQARNSCCSSRRGSD